MSGAGAVGRGKKNRAGEGKATGGRPTATQPLLTHGGEWPRGEADGVDYGGTDVAGAGHGISNALMPSFSKGASSGELSS